MSVSCSISTWRCKAMLVPVWPILRAELESLNFHRTGWLACEWGAWWKATSENGNGNGLTTDRMVGPGRGGEGGGRGAAKGTIRIRIKPRTETIRRERVRAYYECRRRAKRRAGWH